MQFAAFIRAGMLDRIEELIGPNPILRIRTGAAPATPEAARSGTVLATMNLPADYMANAVAGSKAILGTWQDSAADAAGIAAHYEIANTAGTVVGIQGTVTGPGGGGDMEIQNVNIAVGQQITVTQHTINLGGA